MWLDRSSTHAVGRWVATVVLILCFGARIVLAQGWYIVTYALAIYHLNLLLAFLTPKIDPAAMDFDQDDGKGWWLIIEKLVNLAEIKFTSTIDRGIN